MATTDTKTRQRLFRERQAQAGRKQVALHLPKSLLGRIDAQARTQSTSRDQVVAELATAALRAAPASSRTWAVDVAWLTELVAALSVFEQVWRTSKSRAVHASVRAAHQRAERAYKAMPSELRGSEAAKKLSYWLGRMDALLSA